ncbi:MAG: alpha/beta hydrolase-fold protein [Pirellulaceae bacterium]
MIPTKKYAIRCGLFFFLVGGIAFVYGAKPVGAQAPLADSTTPCSAIPRSLPPAGIDIPTVQRSEWLRRIADLESKATELDAPVEPDVAVLLKACRYAVEFQELYQPKDFAKIDRLLDLASSRVAAIATGDLPWTRSSGRQVRGFRSRVDGSVQPIGMVLPEGWQTAGQPLPLYVWLHGRGDKSTDLHFICERLDKDGQIVPPGAIVVHPFGRQCVGYKSAGETDVMEAIDFACEHYPVDRRRIVLMGFSMGGAGVWHLAAHYSERFVAASPGAGFAETARYQGLTPDKYPSKYEQMLWGIYDVPGYTRNLFNLPVVAYSGEVDKQIQAARVMEEAFLLEGRQLTHLIGPGMGHKYHPETLQQILDHLANAVAQREILPPTKFSIQTKHPRYAQHAWLTIDGAVEQYADTRAEAARGANSQWAVETKNAQRLKIDSDAGGAPRGSVIVDGTTVQLAAGVNHLQKTASDAWVAVEAFDELRKHPGISGPIDDAFIDPFLVVIPSGTAAHPKVEQWVQCELENFKQRWRMVMRGELRLKLDRDVTAQDMRDYHLVLWGDPQGNQVLGRLIAEHSSRLPWRWTDSQISVGSPVLQARVSASEAVLLGIYP